jgi:uncharacterized protein YozE (UPF0346 family)
MNAMSKSFYHYLMKYRMGKSKDGISELANSVYNDLSFPKGSKSYHEVSSYLEMHNDFVNAIRVFDEVWEMYRLEELNEDY